MDVLRKHGISVLLAILLIYPVSYVGIRALTPVKFCNDRIVTTHNAASAEILNWLYLPIRRADRNLTGYDLGFWSP